ncbi:MAG: glycerophosphodiester phosphodiesterase [Chloroflexi bacterium]|nr:MAG: glycerophosphodiester phosphodiesterase [Chloroflexota bacterium]
MKQNKRILVGILLVVGVVYGVLAWRARPVADRPFFADEGFMVIAHQGGDGLRPGDTMAAFDHAVALGVDVLEMDIHATADGAIVLMHDATVDRTTNGSGAIKEMTLAELKALDAGYNWSPDGGQTFPYRGQGITVPTLEEVFTAYPFMRMNIEIKQKEPSIVQPFCQLIHQYGMEERVLVASFHPETMTEFREVCSDVATSMVEPEIRWLYGLHLVFLGQLFAPPAEAIQIPEYSGGLHVATGRFVRAAHAKNVRVHVWTVNETADMQRLIGIGVDGIITDRPDRLLALLGRQSGEVENE